MAHADAWLLGAAPAPRTPRPAVRPTAVPQPPPLARDDWHTPSQLAARSDTHLSLYTLRAYLRSGHCHGHQHRGRWRTKPTVLDACLTNLDPAAQVRVCGCDQLTRRT